MTGLEWVLVISSALIWFFSFITMGCSYSSYKKVKKMKEDLEGWNQRRTAARRVLERNPALRGLASKKPGPSIDTEASAGVINKKEKPDPNDLTFTQGAL